MLGLFILILINGLFSMAEIAVVQRGKRACSSGG